MAESAEQSDQRSAANRCPRCGQHGFPDGRFCPFDGEALVAARDWSSIGDPLLGRLIDDRYEIEALVGEGGTGLVYRVRHVRLGQTFAMKALRGTLACDRELSERFVREARIAATVSHPGLVRVTDFGYLPDSRPFFVTEWVEGFPLRVLLRWAPLSPERAARLAYRIAQATAAVHLAGIVHRDLKPDNVHVTADDEITVLDFGLALIAGSDPKIARSSIAFGTPHYMSPEQATGAGVDARADVYALGVMLYEMLAGRVPFDAPSAAEVLAQHLTEPPLPPSRWLQSVTGLGGVERVALTCLAKCADGRFASMDHVCLALQDAMPESFRA